MTTVAAEITALFGSVRPWNSETDLARAAKHFAGYYPDRVLRAVSEWQSQHPEKAPKPSDLLAVLRAGARNDGLRDPEHCDHPKPWAICGEEGPNRIGVCRYCHTEIVKPKAQLLTRSEMT